jgi:hypothetical protein
MKANAQCLGNKSLSYPVIAGITIGILLLGIFLYYKLRITEVNLESCKSSLSNLSE